MHVKRFEAATLGEALREVREALGPDALVLRTRSVRREGGLFGRLARPVVEVTAAVDRDASRAGQARGPERVGPDPSWNELRVTRALVDPLEAEVRELRRSVERLAAAPRTDSAEELAEIRRLATLLARERAREAAVPSEAERPELAPFTDAGLAQGHAEALARAADGAADGARSALAAGLSDRLRAPREDDPPVTLFVGPTGVGKTTTIAKLASRPATAEAPPALISTDCHREGGDAMLRGFAKRCGTSFASAVSAKRLEAALARVGERPVLIDTAGRSRGDGNALPELQRLRRALGRRAQVHLVLPATAKERDLCADLARYRPLEPDALVLTKLDESVELGNVANLLLDGEAPPLSWWTDGQRVPDDLHLPEPDPLAERLLGSPG